jgi:hypothetical protein
MKNWSSPQTLPVFFSFTLRHRQQRIIYFHIISPIFLPSHHDSLPVGLILAIVNKTLHCEQDISLKI